MTLATFRVKWIWLSLATFIKVIRWLAHTVSWSLGTWRSSMRVERLHYEGEEDEEEEEGNARFGMWSIMASPSFSRFTFGTGYTVHVLPSSSALACPVQAWPDQLACSGQAQAALDGSTCAVYPAPSRSRFLLSYGWKNSLGCNIYLPSCSAALPSFARASDSGKFVPQGTDWLCGSRSRGYWQGMYHSLKLYPFPPVLTTFVICNFLNQKYT